jgi:hypothetical protein
MGNFICKNDSHLIIPTQRMKLLRASPSNHKTGRGKKKNQKET